MSETDETPIQPVRPDAGSRRIAGGILGLVGAIGFIAATFHYVGAYHNNIWDLLGWFVWPVTVTLFSVAVLATARRWPLLGAGGLLALGLWGVMAYATLLGSLLQTSPAWDAYARQAAAHAVSSLVVLAGGGLAFLARGRKTF